jgi:hypothetical protein
LLIFNHLREFHGEAPKLGQDSPGFRVRETQIAPPPLLKRKPGSHRLLQNIAKILDEKSAVHEYADLAETLVSA